MTTYTEIEITDLTETIHAICNERNERKAQNLIEWLRLDYGDNVANSCKRTRRTMKNYRR